MCKRVFSSRRIPAMHNNIRLLKYFGDDTINKSKPIKCCTYARLQYITTYFVCCTRKIVYYYGDIIS